MTTPQLPAWLRREDVEMPVEVGDVAYYLMASLADLTGFVTEGFARWAIRTSSNSVDGWGRNGPARRLLRFANDTKPGDTLVLWPTSAERLEYAAHSGNEGSAWMADDLVMADELFNLSPT